MSENQSSANKASEPRTAPVPRVESAQTEATASGAATQRGAAKASGAKTAEPISAAKAPEGVRVAAPASGDKASQKADKKAEKKATREAFARPKSLEEAAKPQNRAAFRAAVALYGLFMIAYGVWQVLGGVRVIPDAPQDFANPSVQSNYVFFAAAYVGVGLSFVFIALKFKWVNMLVFSCLVVFLGGVGRILSWAFFGTPHWSLIVLMVISTIRSRLRWADHEVSPKEGWGRMTFHIWLIVSG